MTKRILSTIMLAAALCSASMQGIDFTRQEDLKGLGAGRIVGRDRSIIKEVTLHEIKEYWIVYIKQGSIHDLMIERIDRIEFPNSKWGSVKLEFRDGKPAMLGLPR